MFCLPFNKKLASIGDTYQLVGIFVTSQIKLDDWVYRMPFSTSRKTEISFNFWKTHFFCYFDFSTNSAIFHYLSELFTIN